MHSPSDMPQADQPAQIVDPQAEADRLRLREIADRWIGTGPILGTGQDGLEIMQYLYPANQQPQTPPPSPEA